MSSNKFTPKLEPIRFDSSGAFIPGGLSRDYQVALMPLLEAARRAVLAELDAQMPEASRAALAAGAQCAVASDQDIALPELMLSKYRRQRRTSELGRILADAKRLRESVDRVVIVGSETDCAAARVLFEACCHPYHNEQGRGDRGARPRIYFAGDDLDNDALQGLLDLLPHERLATTIDDRWGVVAIDAPPTQNGNADPLARVPRAEIAESTSTSIVVQVLCAALVRSCGGDSEAAAQLVVPTIGVQALACGGTWSRLSETRPASECPASLGETRPREAVDTLMPELQQTFSTASLLPASVMGLDIVRLLEGATAMCERFQTAPIGDNPPLDLAGVCELMQFRNPASAPRFVPWGRGLTATAGWCERMSGGRIADFKSEISNFKYEISDFRSEISNLRSEISNLAVNLIVESVRRDRIAIEANTPDDNPLKHVAGRALPDLHAAVIAAAKAASTAAGHPSVDIRLPALDESSLGQLLQMLTLSLRVLRVLRG